MAEDTTQNPGISRRDLIKRGAILGGAVAWATPVVQIVGMSPAFAQTPSDTCTEQWAATVHNSGIGTNRDGTAIVAPRNIASNALGAPDSKFFSLGFNTSNPTGPGGFIDIRFAQPAYRTTGSLVVVVETTNNPSTYPEEKAKVYVSQNGVAWTFAGNASSKTGGASLSVPLSLLWIQYVRVVDHTPLANFPLPPPPSPDYRKADGFDVESIGIACPPSVP